MAWKQSITAWWTQFRARFAGQRGQANLNVESPESFESLAAKLQQVIQTMQSLQADKVETQAAGLQVVYFGIPLSEQGSVTDLKSVPQQATDFHFYLGSDAGDLIQSFIDSPFAQQVERLHIGNSSYNRGNGSDYTEIVRMLARGDFPRLQVLELGVWQLYSNSHCAFGNLGNVSSLLSRLTQLESLGLYGHFDLSHPLSLNKLKSLYIQTDDPVTCLNDGVISQATVTHLFASTFPELEDAYIDLSNNKATEPYEAPDLFRDWEHVPKLKRLELDGPFTQEVKHNFEASELGTRFYSVASIYLPEESS